MIIGIPKEIKQSEFRVGLAPEGVCELVRLGHKVIVENNAGIGIDCTNLDYQSAGAEILNSAQDIFKQANLIVKVKEPQPSECAWLQEDQTIFTYLHLAADKDQAQALMNSKCTAIAYETITDLHGGLPVLAPMSEVAGRLSVQVGAQALEKTRGGRGILLGGVPGVEQGHVVIIGGGVVGRNAALMAMGKGARVTILDTSLPRLQELDFQFGSKIATLSSTKTTITREIKTADLVIGAVLLPGGAAPKLVTRAMLACMRPGSVIVDVAIDQGGCFETSKPTTHAEPTFVVDKIIHYCVANMPGAVPRTSAYALHNATLPFIINLANKGIISALKHDYHLRNGLNVYKGKITHPAIAESLNLDYVPAESVLNGCLDIQDEAA